MTHFPRSTGGAFALTLAVLLAAPAQAAIDVYSSPAAFAAAVQRPFTDSLNDLALDFASSPLARASGPYNYSVSATGGLYAVGSAADVWMSTDRSGDAMRFGNFGSVSGFGGLFFGSDVTGAYLPGQSITVTATDSAGAMVSSTLNDATTSSFVGFVSTGALLTQVQASIGNPNNYVTANDLTLAVPEPSAWALWLGGLALGGALQRRRQRLSAVLPVPQGSGAAYRAADVRP